MLGLQKNTVDYFMGFAAFSAESQNGADLIWYSVEDLNLCLCR